MVASIIDRELFGEKKIPFTYFSSLIFIQKIFFVLFLSADKSAKKKDFRGADNSTLRDAKNLVGVYLSDYCLLKVIRIIWNTRKKSKKENLV